METLPYISRQSDNMLTPLSYPPPLSLNQYYFQILWFHGHPKRHGHHCSVGPNKVILFNLLVMCYIEYN